MLILRTPEEIKSYIEGYNACYNQYNEFLKKRPIHKAKLKMKLMVEAVNNAMLFTEEGDDNATNKTSS